MEPEVKPQDGEMTEGAAPAAPVADEAAAPTEEATEEEAAA